jgi:uncharacterized membrane protein
MEQLPLSFIETIKIVFYFSSLTILLGVISQFSLVFISDKKVSLKLWLIIGLTQSLAFAITLWLWLKWPMGLKILYGPILFPAILAQIISIPLVSNFFKYRIRITLKKSYNKTPFKNKSAKEK